MTRPVDVLRAIRALPGGVPYRRPLSSMTVLVVGVGLGLLLGLILLPLRGAVSAMTGDNPRAMAMVIGIPLVVIGLGGRALVTWWRERPTVPFDFPHVVHLPGWFVWTADEALYLTRRSSLVCLFRRPADEALADVLAVIDPDHQLAVTGASQPGRLELGLADDPETRGSLRRLPGPDAAYALVMVHEDWVREDVENKLGRSRLRTPDEPPQKWRPLARPVIANARAVRRA